MKSSKKRSPNPKLAAHNSRVGASLPGKKHHCIVIGGGLAGLSAAYRLSKRKWNVTVLEASARLGGRVWSYRFPQNRHLVCELGGEWIGADHCAMRRLAAEFNLDLLKHEYSFFFWDGKNRSRTFQPGGWCFSREAKESFEVFAEKFKRYSRAECKRLDQLDWWNHLRLMGFTHEELLQRDLMDSTDFGESIRLTSAYAAATEYLESDASDEMDSKIVGGNSRLVEALRRGIGNEHVRTDARVKKVLQKGERVTAVLASGARVSGDMCICTVPAPCLYGPRGIEWEPPLPDKQRETAKELQYSRIMKSAVLYKKKFWPTPSCGGFSVFTSRVSDFCFDSTYLQEGNGAILCSYAIGEKADDLAAEPNKNDVMRWITEDVLAATSRKQAARVAIKTQPWQNEPWIGGAYAFYLPGQWFRVRPILQQPHGRVLFAGEHLADWQGFMEGAVNTGEAAADAL